MENGGKTSPEISLQFKFYAVYFKRISSLFFSPIAKSLKYINFHSTLKTDGSEFIEEKYLLIDNR